jgi:hypothetical protein
MDASTETGRENRDRLFDALYQELHRVAQRELRRNATVTLSPTTLLHETYLSMSSGSATAIGGRAQFMTYAARAMRGLSRSSGPYPSAPCSATGTRRGCC